MSFRRRQFWGGLVVATMLPLLAASAGAAGQGDRSSADPPAQRLGGADRYVPGEVIVRLRSGVGRAGGAAALEAVSGRVVENLPLPRASLVRLGSEISVPEAVALLEADPDVVYAEPNFVRRLSGAPVVPNDTRWAELWGLHQASDVDIDAPEAWDLTTGGANVVVAVIDSGVAYDHPDLTANIWTNAGDPPGNGDQDANGYTDDTHGWDFVGNDGAPLDGNGHGTHVAGTIGAAGNNNLGVAGVNWNVGIMPLRAGDATGSLTTAAIVQAYAYACANGARVVNGSFGGGDFSQTEVDTINSAPCANTLFVFAAGNGGNDGVGDNNDDAPQYPCNYGAPPTNIERIICVAATTQTDTRATFSNHGPLSVDLAAPGVATLSAWPAFTTVHTYGFEGDNASFDAAWGDRQPAFGNTWGRETFTYPGGGAYSLADSPGGNYLPNSNLSIRTLPAIPLTGHRGCSLEYWMRMAFGNNLDGIVAEASTGTPGPWTRLGGGGWTGNTGTKFFRVHEDLGGVDNANAYLRYRLVSDGTSNGTGVNIDDVRVECLSTTFSSSDYRSIEGTSMATPHVAGVAALVLAVNGALTPVQLKAAILANVDPVAGLAGVVTTGGRLNAFRAVQSAIPTSPPPPSPPPPPPPPPPPVTQGCTVPALKGKTLAQAKTLLKSRKCTLGKVSRVFHAKVKKGRIVKQSPAAGQKRPPKAKVNVSVSRGKRR